VGRASNRKKAQRGAGPGSRHARQSFRTDAAAPRQLPDGSHGHHCAHGNHRVGPGPFPATATRAAGAAEKGVPA